VTDTRIDHFSEECACGCVCFRGVASEDRLHGADDVVRIASDGGAVLVEDVVPLSELFPWRSWIFQMSACSATMRRMRSPAPPIRIGGCGLCLGLGSQTAPLSRMDCPSKSNGSSSSTFVE